jgi:peptide/nickel transport system permease protein
MNPAEVRGSGKTLLVYFRRMRVSRLLHRLDIWVPAAILVVIGAACLVGPLVHSVPPVGGRVADANLPLLSSGHLLGTDANGNDNLSRLLYGGRASLQIALAVNLIGLVAGGLIGALGGYLGGVQRVLDVLIAFPPLILVLAVVEVLGPGHLNTIWALAFFSVPAFARVARAATLRLRNQPFMTAALLCGTGILRVLARHITPNILPQLATFALLGMGVVITIEGGLSFLGLGVPLPEPSWGNMIFQGQQSLLTRPVLVLLPGGALFLTVLAFNLLGDALRARAATRP